MSGGAGRSSSTRVMGGQCHSTCDENSQAFPAASMCNHIGWERLSTGPRAVISEVPHRIFGLKRLKNTFFDSRNIDFSLNLKNFLNHKTS